MAWIPLSQVVSAMQTSLASAADTSTGFAVSELKVDLPAEVLTLGGQVVVQLPGQLDSVQPAKLAKLSFTLGATAAPEVKGPPSPWSRAYTGTLESLYSVAVSGTRVLVAGRKGTLLESKDSGASFLPVSLGSSDRLHAAAISPAGYAIAAGHNGALFQQPSEDAPWTKIALGTELSLNAVAVWDDTVAVTAANGVLFVSYDRGKGWEIVKLGDHNLHGLWGAAPDRVFVAGAHGRLWKTDLKSPTPLQSGVGKDLFSVWGAGPHHLYAVGHAGTIIGSNDGGESWHAVPSGTGENLYSVWGTGPGNVVVAGRNGTVLRSSDGASFKPLSTGLAEALHAVASTAAGAMIFAGTSGLVLAYRPPSNQ